MTALPEIEKLARRASHDRARDDSELKNSDRRLKQPAGESAGKTGTRPPRETRKPARPSRGRAKPPRANPVRRSRPRRLDRRPRDSSKADPNPRFADASRPRKARHPASRNRRPSADSRKPGGSAAGVSKSLEKAGQHQEPGDLGPQSKLKELAKWDDCPAVPHRPWRTSSANKPVWPRPRTSCCPKLLGAKPEERDQVAGRTFEERRAAEGSGGLRSTG